MMKILFSIFVLWLGIVPAVFSQTSKTNDVVAKVNDVKITASNLDEIIMVFESNRGSIAPSDKAKLLDDLILREVIAQEAVRLGLLKKPVNHGRLEMAKQNAISEIWWADYIKNNPVTESDVKAEYDVLVKMSKEPRNQKEYNISQIVLPSEGVANDVIKEINSGQSFDSIAKKRSLHKESAIDGGRLGWFLPSQLISPLGDVVANIGKGKMVSLPVKSAYGWHVIQVNDIRDFTLPTYDQLKAKIRTNLLVKKRNQAMKDLLAKYKIVKN